MSERARGVGLSHDLMLPLGAVTETLAILGKRGSGMMTTARVLVEEMPGAGARARAAATGSGVECQ